MTKPLEFVSQIEYLLKAEELLFDATAGFNGPYRKFLSHSIGKHKGITADAFLLYYEQGLNDVEIAQAFRCNKRNIVY